MKKRLFLVATTGALLALSGCSTTTSSASPTTPAEERASINAGVDKALASLYAQVSGSRELVSKSKGVLVFPSVISAGLGIGGTYGKGALRVHDVTTGYYSTAGASVGWIAGAESKALYILFMTQDALDKFQASKGWTAGVDASVTALSVGADAGVTTQTAQQPVVGYVLTNGGLMANLSFDGTKFSRLDL